MKKSVVLCTFLALGHVMVFASATSPGNWRWRNNDGNETTATWATHMNTPIFKNDNSPVRLRMSLYTENVSGSGDVVLQYAMVNNKGGQPSGGRFYYDKSASPSYNWVNVGASGAHWQMGGAISGVTNGGATTQQLGHVAGRTDAWQAGYIYTTANGGSGSIAASRKTESEFFIQPTSTVQPNVMYYFRFHSTAETEGTPKAQNYQAGYPSLIAGPNIASSLGGPNLGAVVLLSGTFTAGGTGNSGSLRILNSGGSTDAPVSATFTAPFGYSLAFGSVPAGWSASASGNIGTITSNSGTIMAASSLIIFPITVTPPASATTAQNAVFVVNNVFAETNGTNNVLYSIFKTN